MPTDHNFNTPPDILDKVRLLDKRGIGLDPCSNANSMVQAKTAWSGFTTEDHPGYPPNCGAAMLVGFDGLAMPWRGHGLVFMNPPHSMSPHNIEPWMEKAACEFAVHSTQVHYGPDQFVGLIPAKPDTAWFHDYVTTFQARCFLRGRPKFWLNGAPMPGPGKFASMLIYAGNKPHLFRDIFGPMGWVV